MSQNESADGSEGSLLAEDSLDDLRAFPWLPGVLTGAVSWLVGYALMASLFVIGPASLGAPTQSARLKLIGHLFYNAQFVDRIVSAPMDLTIAGGRRTNFLLEVAGTQLPLPVYFAPPIIALVVAGVLFGVSQLGPSADYADTGLTGLAMAVGYMAVALIGTFLFVTTAMEGNVTASPDRIQTLVFCFAYPFFLGTVGSLVGIHYDRE